MPPLLLEPQQSSPQNAAVASERRFSCESTTNEVISMDNANEYMRQKINDAVQLARGRPVVAEPPQDYPTVDLSPWVNPTSSDNSELKMQVVRQVLQYAVDGGSFNLVGHGVSNQLLQTLDVEAGRFFDLSLETKQTYVNPWVGQNRGGYVGNGAETISAVYGRGGENDENKSKDDGRDWREIYSAVFPEVSSMNVPALSAFQEAMHEYLIQMHRLDSILFELLTEALNLAKNLSLPADYLECARGSATGLLRCSRYPNNNSNESVESTLDTRLGAHSDWGLFTIIHSKYPGLQEIRNGQWVPVPIRSGELHVALGQTLHLWSNQLFCNNIHRVIVPNSSSHVQNRSSYAYFCADGEFGSPNDGIGPICSENEIPRFRGTINAAQHGENNARILFGRVEI